MSKVKYHLAQVNIAKALAPMTDPAMAGFVNRLDDLNALADETEGFVWRLQGEDGNNTALRVFEDPMLLINMSVWESVEALRNYTYKSAHVEVMRERKKWFTSPDGPHLVLWWIPAGEIPTPDEAKEKLRLLELRGPTPDAFTFRNSFPPPGDVEIVGSKEIPIHPGDTIEMVNEIRRGSILAIEREGSNKIFVRALTDEQVEAHEGDLFVVLPSSNKQRLEVEKYEK